jgi:hypothetical protein
MTHIPTTEFAVLFEWPESVTVSDDPRHALQASTLDQAKMQAAMLYAGAAFKTVPPSGYSIVTSGGEAYRYPAVRAAAA